ncbi:PREDICTED: protein diaphanous homolog 1-like [Eufriesea mexicana]|uniref:protein diaphanous homolog 1-like n=1 Tax=Eufriesea mexicana TaxID=516756 RepID=UPI00083BFBC0|nr:PREDICTED: protein diaphanous homolog 1-like [Eufriesea mexicana]
MFSRRQSYFSRMARTYPILKLVDVYDRQSFIRAYVLDNVFVCILMHVLFYVALWYATAVARKMEKSNKEMLKIMEQNRTRLEDVMALKDKKAEYDEVVIKTKETQRVTSDELEDEMQRLSTEVTDAADKLSELEGIVKKYKSDGKWCESSAGDVAGRENENAEPSLSEGQTGSHENLKILEPSFPPPQPPEPPPRKYGIFVSRPPGQRRPPPAAAAAGTPPKIGFK